MSTWRDDITDALAAFQEVPGVPGGPLSADEIEVEFLDAPHVQPDCLPEGKVAIQGYWGDGDWLMVGKVGPNSNARYVSQHYGIDRAPSTLALRLVQDAHMGTVPGFDADDPGGWILRACHRVNVLLPASRNGAFLESLKKFLLERLKPRY